MSVRDEDFDSGPRRFNRPDPYGNAAVDVSAAARSVVEAQVDRSPQSWTPRLVWEDLREAGHSDISEEMVAQVMQGGAR